MRRWNHVLYTDSAPSSPPPPPVDNVGTACGGTATCQFASSCAGTQAPSAICTGSTVCCTPTPHRQARMSGPPCVGDTDRRCGCLRIYVALQQYGNLGDLHRGDGMLYLFCSASAAACLDLRFSRWYLRAGRRWLSGWRGAWRHVQRQSALLCSGFLCCHRRYVYPDRCGL